MGASRYRRGTFAARFSMRRRRTPFDSMAAASLSFSGFAFKNLWRRRLRTLLTLGGIGMAVGAFVGMVGFSSAFEQQWQRIYSSSGTDIAVIHGTFLNTSLDESATAKIKRSEEHTSELQSLRHLVCRLL